MFSLWALLLHAGQIHFFKKKKNNNPALSGKKKPRIVNDSTRIIINTRSFKPMETSSCLEANDVELKRRACRNKAEAESALTQRQKLMIAS